VLLCRGAIDLLVSERDAGTTITGGLKAWMAQIVLPVAFGLVALRLVLRSSSRWSGARARSDRFAMGVGSRGIEMLNGKPAWPGIAVILIAATVGAPIFAILGGAAVLLFLSEGVGPSAILIETYQLSVSPTLPAIPLFTLAGFLLAEGGAPERLLRVFRALFGWMPGGTAIVCALLSAFSRCSPAGRASRSSPWADSFFPRSSRTAIASVFRPADRHRFAWPALAARAPHSLRHRRADSGGRYFHRRHSARVRPGGVDGGVGHSRRDRGQGSTTSVQPSRGPGGAVGRQVEVILPIVVLVAIFGGFATIVEAAALASLYAFCTQGIVHRDIKIGRDFRRVFTECSATVGGVIIILGVAVGFTNYLIDADVPGRLLAWTQIYIHSPQMFLLGLNGFLLIVGCLMDIFSATFVVVPLIVPLGQAFGIHPCISGLSLSPTWSWAISRRRSV
jgi:hypothetical protein